VRAADERATALTAELAAARTELSNEQSRAIDLQAHVDRFQVSIRTHESRDYETAKQLAAREHEVVTLRSDVQSLQIRAAGYLESLQSLEGRRNIFDEQLLGLDTEIGARDAQLGKIREELAAEASRARELAADVAGRQQRIEAL
jgi:chromosome segregation ATPase